jgi:hypothetical protein
MQGARSPLDLGIVYILAGGNFPEEFTGIRTGRYSSKRRELLIQVAVPDVQPDDPDLEVRRMMLAAIELAEAYARKRNIATSLSEIREIVARLPPVD